LLESGYGKGRSVSCERGGAMGGSTYGGGRGARSAMSRRDFLRYGGAGIAGATLLGACTPREYTSHVGAAFTGSQSAGKNTVVFTFGPDESGNLVALIDKFNKENGKGITVEYREMPADSGQYFDKLRTEFQAGTGSVDVIGGDVIWPIQLAANDWIADLSDLFTEEMRSEYLEAPLQANTYKGKIYGVPWYTDAGMFFYRKDLLDKAGARPPETWDEVIATAKKILRSGDARYGITFQGAEYEGGVCNGCEYIWTAGGDILAPEDPSKILIANDAAMSGLETERRLIEEGVAPEATVVYKEQEVHTAFLGGDYVFSRNWPYMFGLAADPAISSLKPEQISVSPLPVNESGDQSFSALGGWNLFINAQSTKKEEAWEFISFLSTDESQISFAINASLLPTKKKIYEMKDVLKKQPAVELAKEVTQNARPRPVHPFYSDMSLIMAEGFNENLKGEASAQATVGELHRELQRIANIGEEVFSVGG
jgi:multiple sugar transport system substrate-binding protein